MARIADLGLQEARIFLLWEAFQPQPDRVSDDALLRLETVLRAAERHEVGLVLSLFCGHMSGVNWLPGWAVDQSAASRIRTVRGRVVPGGAGDIYADAALLDPQLFLAQRLASAFAGHGGLAGWDLGNEFSNLRWPAGPEAIERWSSLLTEALRPARVNVAGGLHAPDLEQDRGIRISSIAASWDEVAMHGYPLYSEAAMAPDDPEWVPFVSATAARFADKRVNAQEFGLEPVKPPETRPHEIFCASSSSLGLLIQAGPGSGGGVGARRTKRSGWAAYAVPRTAARWRRTSAAVPKWTEAGVW